MWANGEKTFGSSKMSRYFQNQLACPWDLQEDQGFAVEDLPEDCGEESSHQTVTSSDLRLQMSPYTQTDLQPRRQTSLGCPWSLDILDSWVYRLNEFASGPFAMP